MAKELRLLTVSRINPRNFIRLKKHETSSYKISRHRCIHSFSHCFCHRHSGSHSTAPQTVISSLWSLKNKLTVPHNFVIFNLNRQVNDNTVATQGTTASNFVDKLRQSLFERVIVNSSDILPLKNSSKNKSGDFE